MRHKLDIQCESEKAQKLIKKSLKNIEYKYYCFLTASVKTPIIKRERVFCYELYHQMRTLQNEFLSPEISINGEPDKRGHEKFDGENPDFIIHHCGTMKHNILAIEVKCEFNYSYIHKDFIKLRNLVLTKEYQNGLFIFFGTKMQYLINYIKSYKDSFDENDFDNVKSRIFVYCIKDSYSELEILSFEDFIHSLFEV